MNDIISRNYSTVTHRSGRGTLSIARCVKRPRSLHVAIYVRGKRVVAHNRYLFPTCLIASNYFTGACQRRWSIHMGVMLEWRVFRSIYQIEEESYLYNFSIYICNMIFARLSMSSVTRKRKVLWSKDDNVRYFLIFVR